MRGRDWLARHFSALELSNDMNQDEISQAKSAGKNQSVSKGHLDYAQIEVYAKSSSQKQLLTSMKRGF